MKKIRYVPPPRAEDVEWHSGPPPEIGWWPADHQLYPQVPPTGADLLRHYNGRQWSCAANAENPASYAAICAATPTIHQSAIRWTDRWWLDADGRHKGETE